MRKGGIEATQKFWILRNHHVDFRGRIVARHTHERKGAHQERLKVTSIGPLDRSAVKTLASSSMWPILV